MIIIRRNLRTHKHTPGIECSTYALHACYTDHCYFLASPQVSLSFACAAHVIFVRTHRTARANSNYAVAVECVCVSVCATAAVVVGRAYVCACTVEETKVNTRRSRRRKPCGKSGSAQRTLRAHARCYPLNFITLSIGHLHRSYTHIMFRVAAAVGVRVECARCRMTQRNCWRNGRGHLCGIST